MKKSPTKDILTEIADVVDWAKMNAIFSIHDHANYVIVPHDRADELMAAANQILTENGVTSADIPRGYNQGEPPELRLVSRVHGVNVLMGNCPCTTFAQSLWQTDTERWSAIP